jgi:hypothetical protein
MQTLVGAQQLARARRLRWASLIDMLLASQVGHDLAFGPPAVVQAVVDGKTAGNTGDLLGPELRLVFVRGTG